MKNKSPSTCEGCGKRIRFIRKSLKLSQEDFAKLAGSSKSSISGYEAEKFPVPGNIITNIYKKTGFRPDWILLGDSDGGAAGSQKSETVFKINS